MYSEDSIFVILLSIQFNNIDDDDNNNNNNNNNNNIWNNSS